MKPETLRVEDVTRRFRAVPPIISGEKNTLSLNIRHLRFSFGCLIHAVSPEVSKKTFIPNKTASPFLFLFLMSPVSAHGCNRQHLGQIDQIDRDLDHLDLNLPF